MQFRLRIGMLRIAYEIHENCDQISAAHDGKVDDAVLKYEAQEFSASADTTTSLEPVLAYNARLHGPEDCEYEYKSIDD